VLATQNPVDLDYKGLGNAGTWFLGRLQTERDQTRVLDGLAGAAASATGGFDRGAMEQQLAGLGNRIFLAHNVHEDAPVLFQTRQTLSYLAGPLTREQIRALSGVDPTSSTASAADAIPAPSAASAAQPASLRSSARPAIPASLRERFAAVACGPSSGERLVYRAALFAAAQLHYVDAKAGVDDWRRVWLVGEIGADGSDPWEKAAPLAAAPRLGDAPEAGASYATLSPRACNEAAQDLWRRQLGVALNRSAGLALFRCADPKVASRPGESEDAFRGRIAALARESRDAEIEKLRSRYAPKLAALLDRAERADAATEREAAQARGQKLDAVVSIGASLVGALFGRKLASASNVSRAARAARGLSRAAKEQSDVARAEDRAKELREAHAALEAELAAEIASLAASTREPAIEAFEIAPRKTDLVVEEFALLWLPELIAAGGERAPAHGL
jgi:hypothetical protein